MAMRIVRCNVRQEYVIGSGQVLGAAGSHDDVYLELSFDPAWDGTTKQLLWLNAVREDPVITILTTNYLVGYNENVYRVPVPGEAKAVEGDISVNIKGACVENGVETGATLSAEAVFKVLPSRWSDYISESGDVTPTQAEQLQAEIDDIKSDIVGAAKAADSKEAAAQSAALAASSADAAGVSEANAAGSASAAAGSAAAAAQSATNAAGSASAASGYAAAAETARDAAQTARAGAEAAQSAAAESAAAASASVEAAEAWAVGEIGGAAVPASDPRFHNNAKYYAEAAASAAESAAKAAAEQAAQDVSDQLSGYVTAAQTAKTGAETAWGAAESAAQDAVASKTGAAGSASSAAASASAASGSATAAAQSATNAANSATAAQTARTGAETARGAAENAAEDAETAQTAAEAAKSGAETAAARYPYVGANGNWYVWSADSGAFVDTGVSATGPRGEAGPYFTPSVSSAGILSWTNNGGLVNPPSVDLAAAVMNALPERFDFLRFSSNADFTLNVNDKQKHWDGTLEASTDGKTWAEWDGTTVLQSVGGLLCLRGTGNTKITGGGFTGPKWVMNGANIRCDGNIETLLDYATVAAGGHPTMAKACYQALFSGCTSLVSAPVLPATTLAEACYSTMFAGCTSLVSAPTLPATTLAKTCYSYMFDGCTSLVSAPTLPATTLTNQCYFSMFAGCTSLISAPAIHATTLAEKCCYDMFRNCTSLTKLPLLYATTLAEECCLSMFRGCDKIKLSTTRDDTYQYEYRIPASGEGTMAKDALNGMFLGTGGTFTGTPTINTTYYTDHEPVS